MDTDTKQSNDAEVLERKLENANNSDERREIIAREISLTKVDLFQTLRILKI